MLLAYFDETTDYENRVTSVATVLFKEAVVSEYKAFLFDGLRRVFERSKFDATPFPVLHANALPNELSDDKKIELFSLLIDSVLIFGAGLARVGYSWNHEVFTKHRWITKQFEPKRQAHQAALLHLNYFVMKRFEGSLMAVYELGFQMDSFIDSAFDFSSAQESRGQANILAGKGETPWLSSFVGSYFSRKRDHLMYAADFVAYGFHLSKKKATTPFQKNLLELFEPAARIAICDEVFY